MREDSRKLIGRRIRQLREKQGYSQAEVARNLEITEIEVNRIEQGEFHLELFPVLVKLLCLLERSLLKQWNEHKRRF